MIVAVGAMCWLVSSWMMSHLGRKPVRGGRPASDISTSRRIMLSEGVFAHVVIRVDSFSVLIELKVRNTVAVIRAYR